MAVPSVVRAAVRLTAHCVPEVTAQAAAFTEGGWSAAAVPQLDGAVPTVCAMVPPRATVDQVSQFALRVWPLTWTDWT